MSFLWGAATSSHQIEGGNRFNDWWAWELNGNVVGEVCSGVATDHWNRFPEDIRLAASLGINSYRFSIEWSRLEPERGRWDLAPLDRYAEIIAECERWGIIPMVTLHHFTLPKWLAEEGGVLSEEFSERFAEYARLVVKKLGSRVSHWCTVNEPMALAIGAFLGGFMPPAEFNPPAIGVASRHLFQAHVAAYDIIHHDIKERVGPSKDLPLQVGIAHNMIDFLPDRRWHPGDRGMVQLFNRFYNRSWLDAIVGKKQHFGVTGLIPSPPQVTEGLGRKTSDYIGINYYTKCYLKWGKGKNPLDNSPEHRSKILPVGVSFSREGDEPSDLGWAVHPKGLRKILNLVNGYGLPIYITENGIADAKDRLRPNYLVAHLKEVAKAIERGIDIRGYFHWSLLDNFEWSQGYEPRFGLIEVDYATLERKLRPSAMLYQKIIKSHVGEAPVLSKLATITIGYSFLIVKNRRIA